MQALAILLCGFSIFSALSIASIHFRREVYKQQPAVRIMGSVLLLTLACLQLIHFFYLQHQSGLVHSVYYHALLFLVAPSFYLFSRPLLMGHSGLSIWQWLHLMPVAIAFFLPQILAVPLSFAIGTVYLLWLGYRVFALRAQRNRFQLEITLLGAMIVIAIIVMLLGLGSPLIAENYFFTVYSLSIGGAFLLINMALVYSPQLPADIVEAAEETYAVSTLGNIDTGAALCRLEDLMKQQRLYQQTDLNLSMLASKVDLSRHQLSELINSQLGKGLSRYIREQRVEAAKDMLIAEPSASVLAVGLSVGFTSQSNFYQAFREMTGMTPGRFRQINRACA